MKDLLQKFLDEGRVEIGGIEYKIYFSDYVEIDDDKNYKGKITYTLCEIELLKGMNIQTQMQVLAHEIVHAMLKQANLDEEHEDEDFVDRLSKQLYNLK